MNKLELNVIGSGGAFDTEITNSSFIVATGDEKWLIDCGYNVFSKLKELEKTESSIISSIDYVFITHMDDDHIGSLKSLIYYRFYKYGLVTHVRCGAMVYTALSEYLPINKRLVNNIYTEVDIVTISELETRETNRDITANVFSFKGIHHVPNYGIVFINDQELIMITGDTKANKDIETLFYDCVKDFKITHTLVFHDYTFFNVPSESEHSNALDLYHTYSPRFILNLKYYHNDIYRYDNILTPTIRK